MLEDKETYTLRELIEGLPLSLREFGRKHNLSEVTLARLRDGKPGMRSTINKLLYALSQTYNKQLTMHNVRGIIIRGEGEAQGQANSISEDAKRPLARDAETLLTGLTRKRELVV